MVGIVVAFVVGVVAGGAVVFVYKAKIQKKVEEAQAKAEELLEEAKAQAEELKAKVDDLTKKK